MSGSLLFNRAQYHRTILALFVVSMLTLDYGLRDKVEQGPTLTGTTQPSRNVMVCSQKLQ